MLVIGAIVCFLPYILLGIATSPYLYDSLGVSMPIFMNGLLPLVSFFKLFGFLAFLMWISMYLLCYTVIFAEPELSAGKTISRTVKVTKGFRFNTVGFFKKWKKASLYKSAHQTFIALLKLYKLDKAHLDEVEIDDEVWLQIRKGKFLPSKNLIFTLALTAHFTVEDTQTLLNVYGYDFEYAYEKDVVIAYLLTKKIFNADMVQAALAEYKIKYLFLKKQA
jgi:hypothetical protein